MAIQLYNTQTPIKKGDCKLLKDACSNMHSTWHKCIVFIFELCVVEEMMNDATQLLELHASATDVEIGRMIG